MAFTFGIMIPYFLSCACGPDYWRRSDPASHRWGEFSRVRGASCSRFRNREAGRHPRGNLGQGHRRSSVGSVATSPPEGRAYGSKRAHEGLTAALDPLMEWDEEEALVAGWTARAEAIKEVDQILESAGLTMDAVMVHCPSSSTTSSALIV
jgi:hypothetical protein